MIISKTFFMNESLKCKNFLFKPFYSCSFNQNRENDLLLIEVTAKKD